MSKKEEVTELKEEVAELDKDISQIQINGDYVQFGVHYVSLFFSYIRNILAGQLGSSIASEGDVSLEIANYLPASLELAFVTIAIALIIGLWLGTIAAKNKNKWLDKFILSGTLIGYSLPIFWWAMLLVLSLSLWLGITPVAGQIGFEYDIEKVNKKVIRDLRR